MDRLGIIHEAIGALRGFAIAMWQVRSMATRRGREVEEIAELVDRLLALAHDLAASSPDFAEGTGIGDQYAKQLLRSFPLGAGASTLDRAQLRTYRALKRAQQTDVTPDVDQLLSRAAAALAENPALPGWIDPQREDALEPWERGTSYMVLEGFSVAPQEDESAPLVKWWTAREPPSEPVIVDREYRIWYGTNRCPIDPADSSKGYSSRRDQRVHYGRCRVFIPESHEIGSIGSGWLKRQISGKDDRLKLLGVEELAAADFWRKLSLRRRRPWRRTGVVFIHGYNVSFREAALRTAQLGVDLGIEGAMAFFSWPSRGRLAGYGRDGQTIEASEDAIAAFLVDFARKSGAEAVHVIAHSMGNRGVLGAVNKIGKIAQGQTGVRFGQFILAAADVDSDVFRNEYEPYRQLGKRTTLYVSAKDLAVEAASWLYDYPRVGFLPPVVVLPGIDTVAVNNIDLTLLGHGYVAEARDVLMDIYSLLHQDPPPDRRFGLRQARTPVGDRYWEMRR